MTTEEKNLGGGFSVKYNVFNPQNNYLIHDIEIIENGRVLLRIGNLPQERIPQLLQALQITEKLVENRKTELNKSIADKNK